MPERRFPNPWSAEDNGSCFIVKDKNGQAFAYVYYEEEPGRRSAARLLTRDEARRIAVNIAKLPQQFREDRVMSEEISFLDAAGKPVSGRFVVRDGMVPPPHLMGAQERRGSKTACSAQRPSQRHFCSSCTRNRPIDPAISDHCSKYCEAARAGETAAL